MKQMKRDEIRDRLKIDPDDLDQELIDQPMLIYHAGIQYSLALSRREGAKDAVKTLAARLAATFRQQAAKTDTKVTDKAILAMVEKDPGHRTSKGEVMDRTKAADKALSLKEGVQARGWSLRELVALQVSVHHSQGDGTSRIRERMDEKRKRHRG